MDWRDQGVLLSSRKHGETSAIIEMFTPGHGRHAGVVRGGAGRRMAPILQPGAQLDVAWRARLDEHIGTYTVEPVQSRAAAVMGDRLALSGLNAMTALLAFCLPEREPHPRLYDRTITVLDLLGTSDAWPLAYLRWELTLLDDLGFGLDLNRCAVTGRDEGLCYVSPKTGRAVSAEGAGEWADRMLPLPPALLGEWGGALSDVALGMRTTEYFLTHRLAHSLGNKPLPEARARLADLMARQPGSA